MCPAAGKPACRTFPPGRPLSPPRAPPLSGPDPMYADSGNGYHLLYPVDLPAKDGGLVKAVLRSLAGRFDEEGVKVDTTVFNAARLTKLYGTRACKGENTLERPHRWTRVL